MKYWVFVLAGGFTSLAVADVNPPVLSTGGVTLRECYQNARHISETLGINEENVRIAEAEIRLERGAILPHVDWVKQQFYQDRGGQSLGGNPLLTQPLSYFQLTQPIFAGFRDWRALDVAQSLREQAKLNRDQADLGLLSDVAAAFYNALSLSDQLAVLLDTRKIILERIQQLRHWAEVGRSRESEVLSEETQLATTDASIEDTKRALADARQTLFYLTEVPPSAPLADDRPGPLPVPVDDALMRAGKRPDLLATVEALHQSELNVRIARGGHLPTLSFAGRSYTERVGFFTDVRWDATFLLDVPLFEGGSTHAAVQQSRSQEIIAQLMLAQLKRQVTRQVRAADEDLVYALSQIQAYDKAADLALRNYKVQEKEYSLGRISNLELLQTLRDMQTTRSQVAVAHANAKLSDVQLHVLMGEGL